MKKDRYELAKELLKRNYYSFSHFNAEERQEWDNYNVPDELVIEWVMDHLETLVKEIYAILDDKSNIQEEKLNTILIKTAILLDDVDNYKIIWYKKIVEIIKKIDERITLGRALTMRNVWDRLILYICLFLSDKEKDLRYLDFFLITIYMTQENNILVYYLIYIR